MKNENAEQLLRDGRSVRLSQIEKTQIREALLAFIGQSIFSNEIRETEPVNSLTFLQLIATYVHQPVPVLAGILIVIAASGGSIAYASRGALPGELLYPVKVSVLEEIPVLLSFSYNSKTKWETLRAEKRLAEAEELAMQGTLDAETSQRIHEELSQHVARIDRWNKEAKDSHNELAEQLDTMRIRMEAVAQIKPAVANADVNLQFAAEAMRDTVVAASADLVKAYKNERPTLDAESARRVRLKLNAVELVVAEGNTRLESGQFHEARILYEEANVIIERAKAILEAN